MSNSRRAWMAAVVGIVVLLLVILTMPPYRIEPKGIVLPMQLDNAPYFGSVSFYEQSTVPNQAKVLGSISLLYHTPKDTRAEQQTIIAAAQQMSAKAGGDGLLISQLGHTYASTPSAMAVMILRGSVLKVNLP